MFSTVLDKVQSLFSGSFIFGNFFPVLTVAVLNYLIAFAAVESLVPTLKIWSPITGATVAAAEFLFIAILAYLLAPLIPFFRLVLEGRTMPSWLRRGGVDTWTRERARLAKAARHAKHQVVEFDKARDQWIKALRATREQASHSSTELDKSHVDRAQAAIDKVAGEVRASGLPEKETLEEAFNAVDEALSKNPAHHRVLFRSLDNLHEVFNDELRAAADVARSRSDEAVYQLRSRFSLNVAPTRLGNTRAAMERYPLVAYSVDFDFLWPRLRIVLKKEEEDPVTKALDAATAKLDAAVLLTVLLAATVVFWTFALTFFGNSIPLFLAVAVLGPIAVFCFYLLADETQKIFGEVLIMAVDARRHELLTMLHQRVPKSLKKEQETWQQLQRALYSEGSRDVRFTSKPGNI